MNLEKEALALLLRSKTALGRLVDSEVHSVLEFLESIGFTRPGAAPVVVPPANPAPALAAPVVAAPIATPPAAPPPPSVLANLASVIEKDVTAFFEPLAPPPAQ